MKKTLKNQAKRTNASMSGEELLRKAANTPTKTKKPEPKKVEVTNIEKKLGGKRIGGVL